MKKKICGLLALFMVFGLLCSCSGKDPSKISHEDSEEGIGCDGYEFKFIQRGEKNTPFDYQAGSTYGDMLKEHIAKKEAELNFTSSYLTRSSTDDIVDTLQKYSAIGMAEASAVGWGAAEMMTVAFGGCLYPLTELEGILDYTDPKFGGWGKLSLCMAHGIPYGVTPVRWPLMTSTDCLVITMYNGQYIDHLGLPTPWEYYEQGKWTFEGFANVLKDYAFTDGETQYPALMMNIWNFALGLWGANGVHMVGEDSNGNLIAGYESPRSLHALEWGKDLLAKNADAIVLLKDYTADSNLINGDCTMIIYDTALLPTIAAKLENFGIAPFPLGPDIQESGRVYLCSAGYSIQIPADTEDPETAGIVLNALCDPFEGYETEDSLIDLLFSSMFFNRDQATFYATMYKTCEPTYQGVGANGPFAEVGEEMKGKKSVTEILQRSQTKMDKYIENYLGENYLYLKEIGFYH